MIRTAKILLLSCLFVFPAQANAQMSNADTKYLPENCFFVLQFDMQKLLTYDKMGSKSLETVTKFFKKEAHFDLMAMKTLTIMFCDTGQAENIGEEVFGIAMTFTNKVDEEDFLSGMGTEFDEETMNGKKIHKARRSYAPSVRFEDGKTILMAKTETLEKMIGNKAGKGKISALLQSASPDAELKGAFIACPMYDTFLATIASEIPVSPFNIEKVFGEAKTAIISGNVTSSTPIYIQIGCKTDDGAKDLAKRGKFLIDLGKATIPITRETVQKERKSLEGKDLGGFEKYQFQQLGSALEGLKLGEEILSATETSNKGKTAYFKVKKMGGLKQMMPLIAKMFAGQFLAVDALQEGLDEPRAIEDFDGKKVEKPDDF